MRFALIPVLLFPLQAFAFDFAFQWTDPVSRTDGAALDPVTELKSYRMQCSGPENAERIVDRAATTAVAIESRDLWFSDSAMQFDDTTGLVDTGFALSSLSNRSFTLEATVQYAGTAARTWTPIFGGTATVNRFFIGKGNGTDSLNIWMSGLGSFSTSGAALFDGQPRRLLIAFDDAADEVRVSVDGMLVSTETGVTGSLDAIGNLAIGGTGHDATQRWVGSVQDVRVSGTANARDRQYVWVDAVQADGTYACRMTAVDTGDRESDWSETVSVLKQSEPVIPAAPSAPTDLRAE